MHHESTYSCTVQAMISYAWAWGRRFSRPQRVCLVELGVHTAAKSQMSTWGGR